MITDASWLGLHGGKYATMHNCRADRGIAHYEHGGGWGCVTVDKDQG